jgi:hypothetical protein
LKGKYYKKRKMVRSIFQIWYKRVLRIYERLYG